MPDIVSADSKPILRTVACLDAHGNPTPLPAAPAWSLSDATLATLAPSADGASVTITLTGKAGTATLGVSVPTPTGALAASETLTITPGAPASVAIVPGTPS